MLQDSGKTGTKDIQRFLGHQRVTTTETYLHDLEVVETGEILNEMIEKNQKSSMGVVNRKAG